MFSSKVLYVCLRPDCSKLKGHVLLQLAKPDDEDGATAATLVGVRTRGTGTGCRHSAKEATLANSAGRHQ